MWIERVRGKYLFLLLAVLVIFSSYVNMGLYEKFFPELSKFFQEYRTLILFVVIVIQFLILLLTLVIEVFILFLTVSFLLKKESYLGQYVSPVLLSTVFVYVVNIFISLYYLPRLKDIEAVYRIAVASPVNYLLKPLLVLFFLYQNKVVSKKPLEWLIVGGVYFVVTYLPGVLLFLYRQLV